LGCGCRRRRRKAGHEIRSRLQKLGLLRESGHEHFNGSLVIPVIAPSVRLTEVYGPQDPRQLTRRHAVSLYLPGRIAEYGTRVALESSTEIILCEALIDALTFLRAGYQRHASYGIEGITPDHLVRLSANGHAALLSPMTGMSPASALQ